MNCVHLIERIEATGARLRVDGDRLLLKAESPLPEPLLTALREYKTEIVSALTHRPTVADSVGGTVEGCEMPATAADVATMPLEVFQHAGLALPFFSTALGDEVVLASDNAIVDPGERRVVYRAAEMWHMTSMRPDTLRTVHEVKRLFGGTVGPN